MTTVTYIGAMLEGIAHGLLSMCVRNAQIHPQCTQPLDFKICCNKVTSSGFRSITDKDMCFFEEEGYDRYSLLRKAIRNANSPFKLLYDLKLFISGSSSMPLSSNIFDLVSIYKTVIIGTHPLPCSISGHKWHELLYFFIHLF